MSVALILSVLQTRNARTTGKPAGFLGKLGASSQRSYERAIREFINWYCSEPRLAFNRHVKGAKKHGIRLGNWLTALQNKRLLSVFDRANSLYGGDHVQGCS
jgi:hypothetical protein